MMSHDSDTMRLNKFLALHAGISRREADEFIEKGNVTINGKPAIIGARVSPGDAIEMNGTPVDDRTDFHYLMLNKPTGYVCSRKRQGDSPTVYDLIGREYQSLKLVGRLDRDSSGLILLTNDGDFALAMTHPRYGKVKKYYVELDKLLEPLHQQMIADRGVLLDDGPSSFAVSRLETAEPYSNSPLPIANRYEVTMSEGRNRQIRRTFAALGYVVTRLHRTDFGPYHLGSLPEGSIKPVTKL